MSDSDLEARPEPQRDPPPTRRPVTPPKLYSTGEVMSYAEISRQTLHNYKRLGLVTPATVNKSGACFYDESVFGTIRRIRMFQRHHKLREIRQLLGVAPDPAALAGKGEKARQRAERSISEHDLHSLPSHPTTDGSASDLEQPVLASHNRSPQHTAAEASEGADKSRPQDSSPAAADPLRRPLAQLRPLKTPPFRIGDLIKMTGYSRQTLHNYTIQGLLPTLDKTPAGHRLYGEDVFLTLRLIEVLKRHRRFDEVQILLEQWTEHGHPLPGAGRIV